MKIKFTASILLLQICLGQLVFAQSDRGVGNRPSGGKRLALVIGNGAYQKTSELANPSNDAADMAVSLKELGFEVLSGTNQTKRQMETLIREFGEKLSRQGGVGLFFYAGHGLQIKGNNYLIPVDAEIPAPDEVEYATINLSFLLGKMDAAGNELNIVILDACRNNPFARSWRNFRDIGEGAGLAKITPPTGTIMLYATQPGNVASDGLGRNGLFTESLLEQIRKPNLELDAMIKQLARDVSERSGKKQMPWKEGIVTGDFYFAGGRGALPAANPVSNPVPVIDNSRSAEDVMWDTIARINTKLAVEGYLSEYPSGKYAATARLMLKVFEADEQKKAKEAEAANPNPMTFRKNRLGMELAYIPAGSFEMGSNNGEGNERPIRRVAFSQPFWMGRTEVTQAQWQAVMGSNPSHFKSCGPDCPVENMTWSNVEAFIKQLNAQDNAFVYSLPTEAEWEYAARAGTTTEYYLGNSLSSTEANINGNSPVRVGSYQPNAWGLYDMYGNLWEMVQDINSRNYIGLPSDGQANLSNNSDPNRQGHRVVRGSAWNGSAQSARSAFRGGITTWFPSNNQGFRVVARPR